MELNRRLQRVVEVLPSGPASPIWDLDGTDSPIASETCTMSTMSDLVSAESSIGCSSPGLPSSSLLPDTCLGGIVDLGDGLHGDGGLFDTAQVGCAFSVSHDSSVTSLDSINTGLEPCDDTCNSDAIKHPGDSYNLSECNTDILCCVKDSCDKTPTGVVFSDQSSLTVGEHFSKIDDLQGDSCLSLSPGDATQPLQSTCETIPATVCATSCSSVTGFNLPVLLSPSSSQSLSHNGTGALNVINLNIPLVASTGTQPSNSASNCAVVRVGQQNLALTNLVLLQGQTAGTPVASTAYTVPSCNLVTALPCIPQTTPGFADQYLIHSPGQATVNVSGHSTCIPFSGSKQLSNTVRLPVILNHVTAVRPTFPVSSIPGCEILKAPSPVSTPYEGSFDSTGSLSDTNMEMDTNRFLNLETDCLPEVLPMSDSENSDSATKRIISDVPCSLPDTRLVTNGAAPASPAEGTMLPATSNTPEGTDNSSTVGLDKCSECPLNGSSDKQTIDSEPDITDEHVPTSEGSAPVTSVPRTTNLSITSIVQLIPAKKPPHIFKCDLCSATFNRLGNYSRHRMIHTVHVKDDFRYKCEQCDRMFLQKCDLKRHQLIHTKEEPYKCSVCFKGYIRKSDLKVHMRFHNREKAFRCSYCPKSFYQSGDLNRHVRSVHLQSKMLTCGHCDQPYGYAKEATLIRHMQTKHKDIIRQSLKQKLGASMENEDIEMTKDSSEKAESLQANSSMTSSNCCLTDPAPVKQHDGDHQDNINAIELEQSLESSTNEGSQRGQIDTGGSNLEKSTALIENSCENSSSSNSQSLNKPIDLVTHDRTKT